MRTLRCPEAGEDSDLGPLESLQQLIEAETVIIPNLQVGNHWLREVRGLVHIA